MLARWVVENTETRSHVYGVSRYSEYRFLEENDPDRAVRTTDESFRLVNEIASFT